MVDWFVEQAAYYYLNYHEGLGVMKHLGNLISHLPDVSKFQLAAMSLPFYPETLHQVPHHP